jgi:hypothetical protein
MNEPPPRRRESIMQRRLRKFQGEDVDDTLDDEEYDEYEPSLPYAGRFGDAYGMSEAPYAYGGRGRGCSVGLFYALLGGLVVFAAVVLFQSASGGIGSFLAQIAPGGLPLMASPTPTVRSSAVVVQQVQQINRLETTSYAVQTVIEAGVQGNPFEDLLFGDRILLIAHGIVVAGVDLSTLSEEDVVVADGGTTVTLQAPPVQVFSVFLDNDKTRVYDRQQGWLASPNKDLETIARQRAETGILRAACEGGVMQRATDDAHRTIEQLLQVLDFEHAVVVPSPVPPCPDPTTINAPSP